MKQTEVVITGVGVVSPIGIGREEFWSSLCEGRSGVRRVTLFDPAAMPVQIAGEVRDFDPRKYVANRKSLKVMSRDARLGMAAASLGCREAGIAAGAVDPDRFGIVLGADRICSPLDESETTYQHCLVDGRFDFRLWATEGMAASFPLGFLRVLPNMIASHISIAHDARGPNNTIHHAELSGLLAVIEAATTIQRGAADVMMAGGASSQMNEFDFVRRAASGFLSPRQEAPAAVMRPFDAARDGQVWGEGAAMFVLESRRHAEARGAKIVGRILGWASVYMPTIQGSSGPSDAIRRAIGLALNRAGLRADEIGHLNAHGLSTPSDDAVEAKAICDILAATPVTALKSYFGNLGAAGGAVELAGSVLGLDAGLVPPTLNFERPDPACQVNVVHGKPLAASRPAAVAINWTSAGQAVAMVVAS